MSNNLLKTQCCKVEAGVCKGVSQAHQVASAEAADEILVLVDLRYQHFLRGGGGVMMIRTTLQPSQLAEWKSLCLTCRLDAWVMVIIALTIRCRCL